MVTPSLCFSGPQAYDDEEEKPGRILTTAELIERLRNRDDIFAIAKEANLRNLEIAGLIATALVGTWLTSVREISVGPEYFDKGPTTDDSRPAQVLPVPIDRIVGNPAINAFNKATDSRRVLAPVKNHTRGNQTGGNRNGGDYRSRMTRVGQQGIFAKLVSGRNSGPGDPLSLAGFTDGIDVVLQGLGAPRSGGSAATNRLNAGIGNGRGQGLSGFIGDGPEGIDGAIDNLMGPAEQELSLKRSPGSSLKTVSIAFENGYGLIGLRSKGSIMAVVMQNLTALRFAYNKRLRQKPGLQGKITVRFAIDEFGTVIFCDVVRSLMDDQELEALVVGSIRKWRFSKIDKPGDVTEVVYPFVFSM
ncbi:MAG: AgmX/PglI C-terminal domain-containing protein [Chitinivibrionales bacterium]|nr:AgmX/PglI C-terminal domain-containing protein [Chitinivibrionales bacterium]